ncbi:hypothetical protein BFP97_05045 [Roseivirga sp. 4D4]|uniref:sensor histidine kinase n=1 Tax=Roseivirga sp. 4D4 TaxID=1889784 RepID=UPI000853309C|nr:PAS domain S-box protein [Roseivirga sp. 4D4]OEK00915.1 hypothetical protein BFP97_05045 [Roseivirga sp. 4D4]
MGQKPDERLLKLILESSTSESKDTPQLTLDDIIVDVKVEPSSDLYHITFSEKQDRVLTNKFKTDKYKLLVEAANDIIYEINLQGQFTYVNPKASEVTGYSREECLDMTYLELVREDWRGKLQKHYRNQVNESIPSTYMEFPIVDKNGNKAWLGQNVQLIENGTEITGLMAIARDISERHDNERVLAQSEEKYRGIIQNLQYGLMEVDLDERIVYANEAMCIISGYTQDELVGQIASDILVDDDTKDIIEREHEKRGDGVASVYKIKLRHKDGSPIYSLISGAPIYDIDGNRTGSIGIHMDITDKQKDEEALIAARNQLEAQNIELKNNEKFLSAINGFVTKLLDDDSLTDIAWEIAENVIDQFDFEDCVIYVLNEESEMLEQLAAYGAKTEKNRIIKNPIHIPLGEGIVGSVALTGKAEIINDTSKDDRYIVDDSMRLSEISVPIVANGRVIGVIDSEHPQRNFFTQQHLETLNTIAVLASNRLNRALAHQKQKEAEEELRDNENKLRKILDSAIDGVITIDTKGIVTEWNRQAEVIFGYTADEAIGKPLTDTIIPPNFREAHDRGMKHYLKTGEGPVLNQKIEISAIRKNGEEFPIELAIIPVKTKRIETFTAFVSDITVQKKVQEETEKALNKERELNELKSRFVAMTSHEFRTPLTTIKQNTDLINFKLGSLLPDGASSFDKYFDRISSEIGRVTGLMNDILMLGRIEAGKIEIKKREDDLVAFCEHLVLKHRYDDADPKTIDFKVVGVPKPVAYDRQLLDHVISNLVSNAIKYSENKSTPEVTLAFNKLKTVNIHVKDFGIGIPKKDQKGLFQSFYRATNVKNIQGSGLGLSIVKEFTEMHGGHVSVISEVGEGAEFIVELPYK